MAQTTSTVDVGTLDGTPAAAETTRPWLQPTGLEVPALQIILEANIPAILWGMPGEGKTASIEALAALQGAHLEVIIGSQFSAHDIAGVPQVIGNEVHHIPPLWAKILAEQPADRRTILFLDELDKCPHETQNAALRIIRERQVGVLRLPSQCRVVAAANPPHLGGWDLPSAIANRFVHLDWALDIPAVLEGLTTGNWPRLRALQIAAADISEPLAFWRGLTTAFLAERTDLIRDMATSIHSQGRAWPSPRSWEMLQQVMAVAYAVGVKPDLEQVLVTGCVGQQAARHLLSWAMPLRDFSPEDALLNPEGCEVPELGTHVTAVIRMVAAAVAANPTQPRLDAAAALFTRLFAHHSEAIHLAVRYLKRAIEGKPELHI